MISLRELEEIDPGNPSPEERAIIYKALPILLEIAKEAP